MQEPDTRSAHKRKVNWKKVLFPYLENRAVSHLWMRLRFDNIEASYLTLWKLLVGSYFVDTVKRMNVAANRIDKWDSE